MNTEHSKQLRAPFKPEQIGKLPKGGVTLDYVGHAEVTDRLLEVDPEWTWRPTNPWPGFENVEGLFIELTVCGVTRPGFGEISGGFSPGDKIKSAIGDAIRNAAMRFGVALDLWMKETHSTADEGPMKAPQPRELGKGGRDSWKATEKQIGAVKKMMSAVPHELRPQVLQLLTGKTEYEDLLNADIQTLFDGGKEAISKAENQVAAAALGQLGAVPVEDDPWAVEKW